MAHELLSKLLSEYEQRKITAELDLEKRKNQLYEKIPRLQEIEEELNNFAINTAKDILNGKQYSLDDLNQKVNLLKLEKSQILKDNNISEDFLQPNYSCKICKDTGYIKSINNGSTLCPCIKQKLLDFSYNKSNITNLDKENFDKFNINIFSDKAEPEIYVLLETVIDNKLNKYKSTSQDDFYKNVLESDLLIIDDLGTECLNSMKLSELFTILNTRLLNLNNKITKTIISTNLDINNIFKNYEERIGSRIVGYYDIYYFFGNDLRFRKKQ